MWHMRQRLLPLREIDGIGPNRKYSFNYVMKTLEAIRKETVSFMDAQTTIISTPNEEQTYILNLLGVVV